MNKNTTVINLNNYFKRAVVTNMIFLVMGGFLHSFGSHLTYTVFGWAEVSSR